MLPANMIAASARGARGRRAQRLETIKRANREAGLGEKNRKLLLLLYVALTNNSSRSNKREQTDQINDILKTLKTSDADSSRSRMNEVILDSKKELLISNTIKRIRGLHKIIKESTDDDELSMLTPELQRLKQKYAQLIASDISQHDSFTTPNSSSKSNSR